jgi:hypothetical protein
VIAILGALMLTLHVGSITAQPDLLKSAVLGAAYPVVLATVAATAATFLRR